MDTSHFTDKEAPDVASVKTSIKKDNIGFKLLKNMGWQEGKGLGKLEDGVIEPVSCQPISKKEYSFTYEFQLIYR